MKPAAKAVVASLTAGEDRASKVSLVVANLLPVVGVLFFGWDAAVIVLLYWAENLIVGFYTILRMAALPMTPAIGHVGKLMYIPFFCLHFGGFCAGHGFFLLMFFKLGDPNLNAMDDWFGPLIFFALLAHVVAQLFNNMPSGMIWPLLALLVSHGVSFVQNFILRGEYKTERLDKLMARPYLRIVLLHIVIIIGGIFVMLFGSPVPLLLMLVAFKLAVDLYFHNRFHATT